MTYEFSIYTNVIIYINMTNTKLIKAIHFYYQIYKQENWKQN